MIGPPVRRIVAVTGGLLAGHLVLAGIYWAFLQLPESNVAMLAASALLVVLLFAGMTGIQGQALLQFATDLPWRQRASQALKDPRPFLAAVLVWLIVSSLCGWVERRHETHRGEIDAWLIAHADWTNTSWMHRTFEWILHGVRYVAGTSLAVGVLAAGVLGGLADVARLHWIRRALGVRRLAARGSGRGRAHLAPLACHVVASGVSAAGRHRADCRRAQACGAGDRGPHRMDPHPVARGARCADAQGLVSPSSRDFWMGAVQPSARPTGPPRAGGIAARIKGLPATAAEGGRASEGELDRPRSRTTHARARR